MEAQHHLVRENIKRNEIHLVYYSTSENVADIFTKPLGKMNFEIFRQQLSIAQNSFIP